MPVCAGCRTTESTVFKTRTIDGKFGHYCEKCFVPIKEREEAFRLSQLEKKKEEADAERNRQREAEEEVARLQQEKQDCTERLKKELQVQKNENSLVADFEKVYLKSLYELDDMVPKLISEGKDLSAIDRYLNNIIEIGNIHNLLGLLYKRIFEYQELLVRFSSSRIKKLPFDLVKTSVIYDIDIKKAIELASMSSDLFPVLNDLEGAGFLAKEHWGGNSLVLTEIEYYIVTLKVLVEPDYTPLENEYRDNKDNSDRYIQKSVKMTVWQRDQGKCVECGTREKLEYDHVIPVAKGGSNTERNVQILCEKCNRAKSARIE